MTDVVTSHNPGASRYEAHIDGELAGFAAYQLADGQIIFTHTQVEDAYEGHGVGGALARFALDDVRATGERRVIALCPFIKGWIEKHPDYEDLLRAAPTTPEQA